MKIVGIRSVFPLVSGRTFGISSLFGEMARRSEPLVAARPKFKNLGYSIHPRKRVPARRRNETDQELLPVEEYAEYIQRLNSPGWVAHGALLRTFFPNRQCIANVLFARFGQQIFAQ